jgi:amino acid adenylation domain-containing protein
MAHHSVFDGTSTGLLLNELAAIYDAFSAGKESPLAAVPVQYADYAIWQRAQLSEGELDRLRTYWRAQLCGDLPILQMPTDHARPPRQSYRGSTAAIELPLTLAESLTKLGRKDGATLFMVLLTAFNALLHRYTSQEDIVIGTPVNGRNRTEVESAIGFFVNTLALRTDLSGQPNFRELLDRVKQTCLGAYSHQDLPFERLVQELDIKRDISRTPLFQAMFAYQDTSNRDIQANDLTLSAMRIDTEMSRTDFSCWVTQTDNSLSVVLEYCTDLFEHSTIVQLLQHYENLLQEIVDDQESPIATLPMLSRDERECQLIEWNATETPYPANSCLHELFEAQCASSPDALAVTCEDKSLTYRELNQRANQLAHQLRQTGVETGTLVGICVDRSVEMLVGLLAILKSGGAYVPLDPDFPQERLGYMLADAKIPVLLTRKSLLDDLPSHQADVVCVDEDQAALASLSNENLQTTVAADDLAYVIYTSGSTGKPKGVQVPHNCVVNFLASMREKPGMSASDRLLAVTTLSFDIATLELFLPLTVGATVIIASRDIVSDGARLLEALDDSAITIMQATPATWQILIDAGWSSSLPIRVLCGGEAMLPELSAELQMRSESVWNLYGPTETTIWSTCTQVSNPDGPVLIGGPIANTQVYVLDQHRHPVPVGVAGELYIGGVGVTRGYVGQPEMTAERFLEDPFTNSGGQLYRTGDLARWHSSGSLEHLGRIDSQVKVSGFRIELGEIESVLSEHPTVDRVAVNVWDAAAGDQRLVAYLVISQGATLDAITLRKHLGTRLPNYMLPQHYLALDELPLTPNGKLDRKQLPPPTGLIENSTRQPPVTPAEKLVAEIWSTLLGLDQIGRHDNFFELGGHSLLAVRAVLDLEKLTGTRIELRHILLEDLFQIAQRVQTPPAENAQQKQGKNGGFFRQLLRWSGWR